MMNAREMAAVQKRKTPEMFSRQPDQLLGSEGGFTKEMSTPNLPTTIAAHFGSPAASAFYATEFYMGFPELDSPSYASASKFDPAGFRSRATQDFHSCGNQSSFRTPCRNSSLLDILVVKSEVGDAQPCRILRENQSQRIEKTSSRYPLVRQPEYPSQSTASVASNKTRIRWTQDLHRRFVESVNILGGAEKATPKGILKLMGSEGLTIFHVKSHLQKFRIARHLPGSTEESSKEARTCADVITKLDRETGLRMAEALRLQLDVQRRLHEQLEVQKNLQLQIEEQGKQLKKMLDRNRIQMKS